MPTRPKFQRYRVPAGTVGHSCVRCPHGPVYAVPNPTPRRPSDPPTIFVDCGDDMGGVAPTADAIGSGLDHALVCGAPKQRRGFLDRTDYTDPYHEKVTP